MRKTKKRKSNFFTILFQLALVGAAVYLIAVIITTQVEIAEKEQQLASLQQVAAEQATNNEELERIKEAEDTDEYMERIARDTLGLVRPGEVIYVDMSS